MWQRNGDTEPSKIAVPGNPVKARFHRARTR